jgi:hypothetical protein
MVLIRLRPTTCGASGNHKAFAAFRHGRGTFHVVVGTVPVNFGLQCV